MNPPVLTSRTLFNRKEMATEITVSFTLRGASFDPGLITNTIGIIPSGVWREGDLIPKTQMTRNDCGWRLSAQSDSGLDIESAVTAIFNQIKPRVDQINRMRSVYHMSAELECVIFVDDEVPAMNIDCDVVDVLSKLDSSIDIDLYLVSDSQ